MHETVREVIGLMIADVLATTSANLQILHPKSAADIRHASKAIVGFSPIMAQNVKTLREFLWARMYKHSKVNRICVKARHIVKDLFGFFMQEPSCLPSGWFEATQAVPTIPEKTRIVADYIAGMTDRFAVQEHRRLFSTETMV